MAHYQRPETGDFGEYDVDSKLAMGSVWRMRVPIGSTGAEVALFGGDTLTVRSNNTNVVSIASERREGPCRVFRLRASFEGTSMLEAGVWEKNAWAPGSPWVSLQVQGKAFSLVTNGDRLIRLEEPHMALNAAGSPVLYSMKYNATVPGGLSPTAVIDLVTHRLKHLAISAHGRIRYANGGVQESTVELGRGLVGADQFGRLKDKMAGGVIWLGGCALGNDNDGNMQRAKAAGCYIVAPVMYMINERAGRITRPYGTVDMFDRYGPKVFTPTGNLMSWAGFLGLGKTLGFSW